MKEPKKESSSSTLLEEAFAVLTLFQVHSKTATKEVKPSSEAQPYGQI